MVRAEILGALLKGRDGKTLQALGLCRDPRFATLAADADWMDEARNRRMQLLTLDNVTYSVLTAPLAEGDVLLVSRAPDTLLDFIGAVDFAYDILSYLVTNPYEGMTVVDAAGRLVYISPIHEQFFGVARGQYVGKPAKTVIENTRLDQVVKSGKAEIGAVQRMRGVDRIVTRIPLRRNGEVVGAIGRIMFKGREQLHEISRRLSTLESQVEFYRHEAATLRRQTYGLDGIVGESRAIKKLRSEIVKLAPLDTSILILGESGTGKELVAHALHSLSSRREASLVTLNAAAMPSSLVEAELFGYEAGSFTGAGRKARKGKFEQAHGGTIFLDEIGDLPIEIQPKLLRVLQNRTIERIGADESLETDFRLICATNADLRSQVSAGKFRLDLYYRISVVTLEAPPLRSRLEDIPILVDHFLRDLSQRHNRPMPEIQDSALDYLMSQKWPGNVRQLRHEIERAFVFCDTGVIDAAAFADGKDSEGIHVPTASPGRGARDLAGTSLKDAIDRVEDEVIADAMARYNGNKKRVAEELGISRSYLYKKLQL